MTSRAAPRRRMLHHPGRPAHDCFVTRKPTAPSWLSTSPGWASWCSSTCWCSESASGLPSSPKKKPKGGWGIRRRWRCWATGVSTWWSASSPWQASNRSSRPARWSHHALYPLPGNIVRFLWCVKAGCPIFEKKTDFFLNVKHTEGNLLLISVSSPGNRLVVVIYIVAVCFSFSWIHFKYSKWKSLIRREPSGCVIFSTTVWILKCKIFYGVFQARSISHQDEKQSGNRLVRKTVAIRFSYIFR